jgi:hypothetical protein
MSDKPNKVKRNKKDGQLLIRISIAEREQFLELCEQLDTSAAREIRQFIRGFIKKNTPIEGRKRKETIHVEESQTRCRKSNISQAGDQEAGSQGREA